MMERFPGEVARFDSDFCHFSDGSVPVHKMDCHEGTLLTSSRVHG